MRYANGTMFVGRIQRPVFICAKTFKRMIELLSPFYITKSRFDEYWSKTCSDDMKRIAQDNEGIWTDVGVGWEELKK